MQISPARRAAFEILRRVEDEGAYSSVLLARAGDDLQAKDRALSHELVLGVLRRQLWLDRTIEHFAGRQIDWLDRPVVIALRLGLYQLRFLTKIPASAAINESVNLVKAARIKSAASFVNAVLRRAVREPNYDPGTAVTDPFDKLAIETSHPRWLIERWTSQFGSADAAAIARANNEPALTAFRFTARALRDRNRSGATVIDQLRGAGAELSESPVAPGAWRLQRARDTDCRSAGNDPGASGITVVLRKLASEGWIYFQDEASQLVAQLPGARAGELMLDVCAAPGSKATLAAGLSPQSAIVAGDLYEHRVRTMKELARQQQAANVQFVVHDATDALPFVDCSFDRVLVDAPCSGTGTLRHNPEIRWRLQPADFEDLAAKQKRILDHASAAVRRGGWLLYSTCSLERDENEAVAEHFFRQHPEFEPAPLEVRSNLLSETGALRTWPHHEGVDGFFAIMFHRKT